MSQAYYQSQPQMTSDTDIQIISTPVPAQPITWKYGLCCLAFCCPCILNGKTRFKADGADEPVQCCCFFCSVLFGVWCCLGTINHIHLRRKKNINIHGGIIDDACIWWCCAPCALTQEHREFNDP
ncbi:3149_t:CDS:2 [Ambispora leptoticha]|uniref:3149_t:CDS:1 n=1 Tax=Ambispora leptoticha TaxID=144679 RepID=A0A9N9IAV9_9GLOM|nr:3149_t:CDS:2 [Ambispora leptoticha]